MSTPRGQRIDVGHEIKPGTVLHSICEYGVMRTDDFYCPHLQEYNSFEYDRATHYMPCFSMYHQRCSCAAKHYPDDFICYATQTTERYIQAHHVINLNGKEVRIMDMDKVIEARRTPDGNCVAVNDIVEVKVSYINDQEIRKKLHMLSSFIGRIVSFDENNIVFDLSTTYNAVSLELRYTEIQTIKLCEEQKKC